MIERTQCTKENPAPKDANLRDFYHPDAKYMGDDYGSLADGGSYKKYECPHCGRTFYEQLPD